MADDANSLERFRSYLLWLARGRLEGRHARKLDASDVVQQTLLEAHQGAEQFRGQTSGERAAWLRQILARNLANAVRDLHRGKRDVDRERSLEVELAGSSGKLEGWLAAEQSSPSEQVERLERALRLADALATLPENQREAVYLRHWQGQSLAEIASALGCTTAAVAGLLHRGLRAAAIAIARAWRTLTSSDGDRRMSLDHTSREHRLYAILDAYLKALDAGQTPDQAEVVRRHPELADDLRAFFADQAGLERLLRPTTDQHGAETLPPPESPGGCGPVVGTFGDYELLDQIGEGGMGVVWRARQVSLNRIVALKMVLHASREEKAIVRFRAEAEIVANLDHPNIVPLYEVGEHEGQHFFSMKLIEGGSLPGSFGRDAARSAGLVATIARAVHFAHQRGILHRDLKPANVLLDVQGTPYVSDFGLARRVDAATSLNPSGAVVGTPSYMAPEQARASKDLTTTTDVYGLGTVLYELLAGRPPFAANLDPVVTLMAVVEKEPTRPRALVPRLDADLETICLKCLEKEPGRRYASAEALADDLERWGRGEPVEARRAGAAERAWRWCRRKPALAALAAAVPLLLAAGVGLLVLGSAMGRIAAARDEAVAARGEAEQAEAEAGRLRQAEQKARQAAEDAAERLARAEYARTVNLAHREYQRNDLRRADEYLALCRPDLRGWEWHYVHRLCHPEWEVISEPLASADQPWSADGLTFLTLGKGGAVNVRRIDGGVVRALAAGAETRWAALSPDAKTVATGDGKTCRLWNAVTGERGREIKHPQAIHSAAFFADGKEVVALLVPPKVKVMPQIDRKKADKPEKEAAVAYSKAALWPVEGDAVAPRVEWRVDPNFKVDRSDIPDALKGPALTITELQGRGLSYASPTRMVRLANGQLVIDSTSERDLWSADGRTVSRLSSVGGVFAPGTTPGTLLTFVNGALSAVNVSTNKPAWSFPLGSTKATALGAHHDGDRVAVGCEDGRVEVWTAKEKKRLAEYRGFPLGKEVSACRLSTDGRWLVAGASSGVRVWRTDCPAGPAETSVSLIQKALSVELKTTGAKPRTIFTFDNHALRSNGVPPEWADLFLRFEGAQTLRDRTTSHRFGPRTFFNVDRTILFHEGYYYPAAGNGTNASTFDSLNEGSRFRDGVRHDADDTVAEYDRYGDRKKTVSIRSIGSQAPIRTLNVGEGVTAAAFARKGHALYLVSESGAVSAWDADTGQRLWSTPAGGKGGGSCVDISPDSRRIAVSGPNDTVLLLDAATGAVVTTLRGHHGSVRAVRFSHDGRRLASYAARELKLWDPDNGQDLMTLESSGGLGNEFIDFSADGSRMTIIVPGGRSTAYVNLNLDLKQFNLPILGIRFDGGNNPIKTDGTYVFASASLTERVFDSRPVRAGGSTEPIRGRGNDVVRPQER